MVAHHKVHTHTHTDIDAHTHTHMHPHTQMHKAARYTHRDICSKMLAQCQRHVRQCQGRSDILGPSALGRGRPSPSLTARKGHHFVFIGSLNGSLIWFICPTLFTIFIRCFNQFGGGGIVLSDLLVTLKILHVSSEEGWSQFFCWHSDQIQLWISAWWWSRWWKYHSPLVFLCNGFAPTIQFVLTSRLLVCDSPDDSDDSEDDVDGNDNCRIWDDTEVWTSVDTEVWTTAGRR